MNNPNQNKTKQTSKRTNIIFIIFIFEIIYKIVIL